MNNHNLGLLPESTDVGGTKFENGMSLRAEHFQRESLRLEHRAFPYTQLQDFTKLDLCSQIGPLGIQWQAGQTPRWTPGEVSIPPFTLYLHGRPWSNSAEIQRFRLDAIEDRDSGWILFFRTDQDADPKNAISWTFQTDEQLKNTQEQNPQRLVLGGIRILANESSGSGEIDTIPLPVAHSLKVDAGTTRDANELIAQSCSTIEKDCAEGLVELPYEFAQKIAAMAEDIRVRSEMAREFGGFGLFADWLEMYGLIDKLHRFLKGSACNADHLDRNSLQRIVWTMDAIKEAIASLTVSRLTLNGQAYKRYASASPSNLRNNCWEFGQIAAGIFNNNVLLVVFDDGSANPGDVEGTFQRLSPNPGPVERCAVEAVTAHVYTGDNQGQGRQIDIHSCKMEGIEEFVTHCTENGYKLSFRNVNGFRNAPVLFVQDAD